MFNTLAKTDLKALRTTTNFSLPSAMGENLNLTGLHLPAPSAVQFRSLFIMGRHHNHDLVHL